MNIVIFLGILLPIVIFFLGRTRVKHRSRRPNYENIAKLEAELLGIKPEAMSYQRRQRFDSDYRRYRKGPPPTVPIHEQTVYNPELSVYEVFQKWIDPETGRQVGRRVLSREYPRAISEWYVQQGGTNNNGPR